MRWTLTPSPAEQENTLGNYETESLKPTCKHLRNHVHVLCKLAQEQGEGGRLFKNNNLCHLLHGIRWQSDATSPGRRSGEKKTQFKDSVEI